MRHNPTAAYRKLVLNPKATQCARIRALRFLGLDAPYTLLRKLINDFSTPGRLAALATDLYAEKIAIKQERDLMEPTDASDTNKLTD